jgi:hypothetical protein
MRKNPRGQKEFLDPKEFDRQLARVRDRLTDLSPNERATPVELAAVEPLSKEVGNLVLSVARLSPDLRDAKLRQVEQLGDIVELLGAPANYYSGSDLVFGRLVSDGIGKALSWKDGLGGEQIDAFRRYVQRIRDHLVKEQSTSRGSGEPVFSAPVNKGDGSISQPLELTMAIQILGKVIVELKPSAQAGCYHSLIKLADEYRVRLESASFRAHHGLYRDLYAKSLVSISPALSNTKMPLAQAYQLRRELETAAQNLRDDSPIFSQRLHDAAKPSVARRILERGAVLRQARRAR